MILQSIWEYIVREGIIKYKEKGHVMFMGNLQM